jgi:hypothetical protein
MTQWPRTGTFEVGGVYFHVVPEEEAKSGKQHKKRGHMVLEFWQPEGWLPDGQWNGKGRWIPVPMALAFMLTEFFYAEEEFLYPKAGGNLGGDKFMRYCWDAAVKGWRHARDNLEQDKAGKAARISRPYRNHVEAWELLP